MFINWSPVNIVPLEYLRFILFKEFIARFIRYFEHGIFLMFIPGIKPIGSPIADVSMSCCATLVAMAISEICKLLVIDPATPVFIM